MNSLVTGDGVRRTVKRGLARVEPPSPARGATLLIYHRVGGGSRDELDLTRDAFVDQMDALASHPVVPLDAALDALDTGDTSHRVVLTFDDGFAELYTHAWPELRTRAWPFTVYLATAHIGRRMDWDGNRSDLPGTALQWDQLAEMVASGLCTVGNHTHHHVPPARLDADELDACSNAITEHLGVVPRHFAYPWGVVAGPAEPLVRERFRSAATGRVGRNRPGADVHRLRRVPVRRTDPPEFFRAKLTGRLWAERTYDGAVTVAKRLGLGGGRERPSPRGDHVHDHDR